MYIHYFHSQIVQNSNTKHSQNDYLVLAVSSLSGNISSNKLM